MDEIERLLGADVVAQAQTAVSAAYVAARSVGSHQAEEALEELMLALLASVIIPTNDMLTAMRCVTLLRQALADTKGELACTKH